MNRQVEVLSNITVVDFAPGMAAALVSKMLRELGARILRVPPPSGDPFAALYPAYEVWRTGQTIATDLLASTMREQDVLTVADLCIVGGEAHPDLQLRDDAHALASRFPHLIVLDIVGAIPTEQRAAMPAVDILAQARSGLVWELGESEPVLMSGQPCNFAAAVNAIIGIGAALYERERSRRGQVVTVSLEEGALAWLQPYYLQAQRTTRRFEFVPPKAAVPIMARCRDGKFVHVVLGASGSKYKLYKVLGIADPSIGIDDPGLPDPKQGPELFFGDVGLLSQYIGQRDSDELLQALWAEGVVAEPVYSPGECWDSAQVQHNGVLAATQEGVTHVGLPARWEIAPGRTGARIPQPRAASLPVAGFSRPGAKPLAGIRVLDFGMFVAGPMASVPLADLGADVIKVEPLEGDPLRSGQRFYTVANRGKRAISIDLKVPEGAELARRLCESADVVCSNFRAGVAARLGIDAPQLHARRADLVVLNNAGFGASGPKARHAAFDPAIQAICGLEVRNGGRGNPPRLNRCMPADFMGGMLGAAMSTLALYRRARCGDGADITVPLLDAGLFLTSELIRQRDGRFEGARPIDAQRRGIHPAEKIYRACDGWLAIVARSETQARALAAVLSLSAPLAVPRDSWGDAQAMHLTEAIAERRVDELLPALRARGVWVELCREGGPRGLVDRPELCARGTVFEIAEPELQTLRGLGVLFQLGQPLHPAPLAAVPRGAHTREILAELGYAPDEIAGLYQRKVVA